MFQALKVSPEPSLVVACRAVALGFFNFYMVVRECSHRNVLISRSLFDIVEPEVSFWHFFLEWSLWTLRITLSKTENSLSKTEFSLSKSDVFVELPLIDVTYARNEVKMEISLVYCLLCNLGLLSQELRFFQFDRPKTGRVRAKTRLTGQRDRTTWPAAPN